jgi:hypothetical protein
MMLLVAAALLPRLFWDAGPETAPALREAGIERIAVAPGQAAAWNGVTGIEAEAADPQRAIRLVTPSVDYRANQATASRTPWLNSNAWRILRRPEGVFYYDVKGSQAALAAAEAFTWRAAALIHTDAGGLQPFADMLRFLKALPEADLVPVADIGFQDDGSAASGEVMNLMVKSNLLFRVVRAPERSLKLNVKLGTKDYPLEDATNPAKIAQMARANLSDDRRSVRLYGTTVVVARLTGGPERLRVQLLNYAGGERRVDGIRVRVLGRYSKGVVAAAGSPGMQLLDWTSDGEATEFTLPEIKTCAVVDLWK